MLLILLILIPLLAGIILFFAPKDFAKILALATSIATLVICIILYPTIKSFGVIEFQQQWLPQYGMNFILEMRILGYLMCLLTSLVFTILLISIWNKEQKNEHRFFGLMLLSMAGLMGVFLANDAFVFYIFWEFALIPVYFLCSTYGDENKIKVSIKFFIYTLLGSLLMLVGIMYLYQQMPVPSFAWQSMASTGANLPIGTQATIFALFFIAFAIKMPLFPFHTWQPDTYESVSTPVTVILSALMVKMGLFAVYHWLLPLFPNAALGHINIVLALCVIGILYASLLAIVQTNIKRLIAYSSIAHVGLMCAAMFAHNENFVGIQGAILQMFNHGINILGLWILVSIIENRINTLNLNEMGGVAKIAPNFTFALVVITLANIALPLTNSFAGEFLMFNGLFTAQSKYAILFTVLAGLSIILAAIYSLQMIKKVAYGELKPQTESFTDLTWNEKIALYAIIAISLILGFFPNLILNLIQVKG